MQQERQDLGGDSHDKILEHVTNLNPQERDAYLRAINPIMDGGGQAMHPDPDAFMRTVSTVHQDKTGRGLLNKHMSESLYKSA